MHRLGGRKKEIKRERRVRRKTGGGRKKNDVASKLQLPDFARGHPLHYYPGRNVLDFADRKECGILTVLWP